MCGITGYSGEGDAVILGKMNDTLQHRGPDDSGIKIFDIHDSHVQPVGIAMRRLAIIDLSPAGHQPMSNEDDTVWIVFNGEIYNFAELRQTLKREHTFKGQSDTEIIVHLYEEIGTDVFSKIQGMFAIAIYDSRSKKLILARDRMGKKPLYWSLQNGGGGAGQKTLLFGSELKALIVHPAFKREIDLDSLNKYFLYENVPTPHSMFKNTWKLEPGTFLIWDGREATKKQFWKPTFLPKVSSFNDSLTHLNQSLQVAVDRRLVSDVPLGIFLSGGIDSSTVAYYAQRSQPGKVKTFSIGFKEGTFDESAYARKVAKHLNTEHFERILSVNDCLRIIPKVADLLDEPVADASIVPTYLLSEFTREHVTVALGGDGGDELFCGYDPFIAHKAAAIYSLLPAAIRMHVVQPIVNAFPTQSSNMSFDFRAKKFVNGFEGNVDYRDQRWLSPFTHAERLALFAPGVRQSVRYKNEFEDIDMYLKECDSKDFYDRLGYLYERMYMMDQVLVKVDRASMMNSLEVRAPFLDTEVVDLANRMPTDFKFHGFSRKYILKKLMEGKLPHDIIYRPKKGFGMPIAEWIRGDLKPLVLELLGEQSLKKMGVFEPAAIRKLLDQHFNRRRDNRKQIWTLLTFALWWRKWMK
ncbi:MAG: asparagine synthase (glutamine-hydrolyzing) [Patescibacteria group bacterium]|nr:asparagine synthase (glutamine-hydrolyzing) [Patescibacteria group bacterium]